MQSEIYRFIFGGAVRVSLTICLIYFLMPCVSAMAFLQSDHSAAPILYGKTKSKDDVAKLKQLLESGKTELKWDDKFGWLPDFLDQLDIPSSSQTLVFSKTSQQNRKISPATPRALFFNDEVYVGYVQQGDFLEIAAVDPQQGAVFYTLDQKRTEIARIKQASSQCLSCHETHKTQNVPGFLVRSVFPKSSGHPDFRLGTTRTDHTTPYGERFGGWYVTGQHGKMRHRGNVFIHPNAPNETATIDKEAGANLTQLPQIANPESHLESSSDIVALMLLEHQSQFHNYVTQASFETRQALHYQQEMNRILDRAPDFQTDSTKRRIRNVANELVDYLLFCGEFELESPVSGNPEFIVDFSRAAKRDSLGRSLRDLDLQQRLLKYPCSYLIYTEAFCSLPKPVLEIVIERVESILSGNDRSDKYRHLSMETRTAIHEVLIATHPLFKDRTPNTDDQKRRSVENE